MGGLSRKQPKKGRGRKKVEGKDQQPRAMEENNRMQWPYGDVTSDHPLQHVNKRNQNSDLVLHQVISLCGTNLITSPFCFAAKLTQSVPSKVLLLQVLKRYSTA